VLVSRCSVAFFAREFGTLRENFPFFLILAEFAVPSRPMAVTRIPLPPFTVPVMVAPLAATGRATAAAIAAAVHLRVFIACSWWGGYPESHSPADGFATRGLRLFVRPPRAHGG